MSKDNLYGKSLNSTYYSSMRTEPDMRQELINTLEGSFPEISKSIPALLRRVRRDSEGLKLVCPCVDNVTKEPDKDSFCPICFGEGFYWDEERVEVYKVVKDSDVSISMGGSVYKPGLLNVPIVVFYMRYDSRITKDDKIVQLILDLEGNIEAPERRESIYRIESTWSYRSDQGKLEYWKVFGHEEDVKHLNAPKYKDA